MLIDLTGRRFGRLVVQYRGESSAKGAARWVCRCDCGTVTPPIRGGCLRAGESTSCGCRQREQVGARGRGMREAHRRRGLPVWPRLCRVCNRTFRGTTRAVYCGPGCKSEAARRRKGD